MARELLGAELAPGGSGRLAVGYAAEDVDNPSDSQAELSLRAGGGFTAPRVVPGAQQTLALSYSGPELMALVGASPPGLACCSSVLREVLTPTGGFEPPQVIIDGLAGATVARLLSTSAGRLAVVATERGVWASRSRGGATEFGPARRLSGTGQLPQSMAAVALSGGSSLVAWSARVDEITAPGPRTIFLAAAPGGIVGRTRRLLTVAPGHEIDELALAPRGSYATLAWVESSFDHWGRFHSAVRVADLRGRPAVRTLSSPREQAAGLVFAAGRGKLQVLAWKGCGTADGCSVRVTLRRPGERFTSVSGLGAIDPLQNPAVAVSGSGRALAAWIRDGHVLAAAGGTRWSQTRVVSATSYAADLTVAAENSGGAIAVWTQGTLNESLVGARWRQ